MENKKMKNLFISIVIPAYNEEKNILPTLKSVESYLQDKEHSYEIIVADDGSKDSTYDIANNYAKTSEKIKVFNFPHRGKASTVIEGINKSKGEFILFTDADNATPINELKKLLHYATEENYEVVIGSREGIGAVRKNEPFTRHFMGRVFNKIIQIFLIEGIEDTQCGFKLFKKSSIDKIISKMRLYETDKEIDVPKVTAFDVELLFLAKKLGYNVKSVPIEWTYGEGSKVNPLRDSINNFLDVVKVWWNNKRGLYD